MISPHSIASRIAPNLAVSRELGCLLAVCVASGLCFSFALLAGEVMEGDTSAFDRKVLLLFRDPADPARMLGPDWLAEAARDLTSLGSTVVLGMIMTSVMTYLLLTRKYAAGVLVFAAVGGGQVVVSLLKMGFERPRPDLVPNAPQVFTASFPSAHATLSAVTYLTLGAILMRLETKRRMKAFFLILSLCITVMVGASRVFLGVHWPTDVLAGWAVGMAWALLCWGIASWLRSRSETERLNGASG